MRGAARIALAYALLFQLVFAQAAAERMAFSGLGLAAEGFGGTLSDGPGAYRAAYCLPSGADAPAGGSEGGPSSPFARCVVCAFAALTPPLPERAAEASAPVSHPLEAVPLARAQTPGRGPSRHDPRSSQGPPWRA